MDCDCKTPCGRGSVAEILADAEEYCRNQRLRLTAGRREILTAVAGQVKAVKAYELLHALTAPGAKGMPPTVYRALDFWIKHGFIHRIESMNAFIACGHPLQTHGCQLLICTECGHVIEVCQPALCGQFRTTATENGFVYDHSVLEIYGTCKECTDGH